ncbi:Myb proto-oncogene protein [Tritrichomonas foetus]|uniref:Myb proto-oncogene protein n=1 Tax=Tritrichomonas foetus TaxID=1144522 RepID=A0A1J4J7W5_9EUKA|nr:Myb proto-oncogene protein [Tritrichomonas foetus]|eukprot:OHS93755.1 Myb proto-oncogene protein [Tritrichomonas foetus]
MQKKFIFLNSRFKSVIRITFDKMQGVITSHKLRFNTKKALTSRKVFSKEEDAKLVEIVNSLKPFPGWDEISQKMGTRTARQCRERWMSYLSPDIRVEKWTQEEDQILIELVEKYGNKWIQIAAHFDGRSNSDVKNRWYSHLKCLTKKEQVGSVYHCALNEDSKYSMNHKNIYNKNCCNGMKKKRNRKIVSAYERAIKTLENEKMNNSTHLIKLPPIWSIIQEIDH